MSKGCLSVSAPLHTIIELTKLKPATPLFGHTRERTVITIAEPKTLNTSTSRLESVEFLATYNVHKFLGTVNTVPSDARIGPSTSYHLASYSLE